MAFIKIIQLKDGQANCSNFFFKASDHIQRAHIELGEIAYVPDEELPALLESGLVQTLDGRSVKKTDVVNPDDMP